ncbi:MAG: hypothetical protein ACRBFS_05370 [Aureispira sp.]
MDKENQHDDLGGLHRKPPPNALPPIWEDIAGALDAADEPVQAEEPMPSTKVEEEEQAVDFSVIKAGFVATFGQQEPPKFLWDTIEQDLEAHVETDAPTEFSTIKDGFLAAFGGQHPPQSLWDELVERVDQPAAEVPVEEKANYSRIKKSFERKYSTIVVPLFSWSDLVDRMDSEALSADTADRFSCIKESFEAVYADKIPDAAVAKGLWDRVYPLAPFWLATQQFAQSPWAKRSAVALLLFLGLGTWYSTTPTEFFLATAEQTPKELDFLTKNRAALSPNGEESQATTLVERSGNTGRIEGIAFINQFLPSFTSPSKVLIKENSNNNKNSHSTSPVTKNNSLVTPVAKEKQANKPTTGSIKNKNTGTEEIFTTDNSGVNNGDGTTVTKTTVSASSAPEEQILITKEEKEATTETSSSNSLSSSGLKPIGSLSTKIGTLSNPILPAANISLVEEGWTALSRNYIPDPAIARMEENSFREVRPTVRGKKMHFEFGVEGRVGTSVLLERKGLEEENKDISLCPTGAVGVNFQYYFGMNDALVLGAYPYSTTIQCSGKTSPNSGVYEETAMHLSFMDFTVGYQRILLHYNDLTEGPGSLYARLNLGMGWLTNADTRVNQQPINTPDLYQNLNWNAGLAIGSLHEMQRFVLDYGLMGNIGLNQFITEAQPNVLQPARIVNVGAYVGLRYLFMPRRAPSKKQRQFDWSAPFYIEEPKF